MTTKDKKSGLLHPTRRGLLQAGGSGLVLAVTSPAVLRAQAPTVKIGLLEPLTGAMAFNGTQARNGASFAIEAINAAGGIKSLGGAKLEAVVVDAQSRPDVAASGVDTLAQAGVSVILGCQASALVLASTQAAARYNIPHVVDIGTAEQVVSRGLTNVFRFTPGVNKCTSSALENLKRLNEGAGNPVKTAAIVHEDGPFGSSMAKLLAERLPQQNIKVVESISHPTPQRDFTNVLLRLRAAKPDLVIPSNYLNEFTLFLMTLRQQRLETKAIYGILAAGASNAKFVRENNAAAQEIMDCNHWYDPRKPDSQALAKKAAAANVDMTYDVMVTYACVQLIADALERAASPDRGKVMEALASSTFDGHIMPYGPTKFVNGENLGAQPVNTQVRGDKIELVFPKEFATAEAVFPMTSKS